MAEPENSLFAIDVDTDDYAEVAAEDTPAVDRTFQSEADFLAVKAAYSARQDGGDLYSELCGSITSLSPNHSLEGEKQKLTKREQMLLGYAAGELYYDGEYAKIVNLCDVVLETCDIDQRLRPGLERWRERASVKLGGN